MILLCNTIYLNNYVNFFATIEHFMPINNYIILLACFAYFSGFNLLLSFLKQAFLDF